jgi:EpsD family peptidyl-prolyl cis-trans isomerase
MGQRILLTIVLAFIVSGCERKAEGQTVAIVNNEEITAADLNAELSSENLPATGATKEARARALEKLIDRRILAQKAKADGLNKSPEYLNQQRRMNEDLLLNMLVSRKVNTAQIPSPDEINRYEAGRPQLFANREVWTLQQIIYPLPKDASLTAKLKAANSLDDVAQILTASGIQFTRATKKIDTAIIPNAIYAQIAALKPGEPFIAPGDKQAVASVISTRDPAPIAGDQARTVALSAMRQEQAQKFVQDQVKSLKASAKIQYQPGFGPPSKS